MQNIPVERAPATPDRRVGARLFRGLRVAGHQVLANANAVNLYIYASASSERTFAHAADQMGRQDTAGHGRSRALWLGRRASGLRAVGIRPDVYREGFGRERGIRHLNSYRHLLLTWRA